MLYLWLRLRVDNGMRGSIQYQRGSVVWRFLLYEKAIKHYAATSKSKEGNLCTTLCNRSKRNGIDFMCFHYNIRNIFSSLTPDVLSHSFRNDKCCCSLVVVVVVAITFFPFVFVEKTIVKIERGTGRFIINQF